jgi:hypothetical protein
MQINSPTVKISFVFFFFLVEDAGAGDWIHKVLHNKAEFFLFFLFFGSTGVWIEGLASTYHLSHTPALFYLICF